MPKWFCFYCMNKEPGAFHADPRRHNTNIGFMDGVWQSPHIPSPCQRQTPIIRWPHTASCYCLITLVSGVSPVEPPYYSVSRRECQATSPQGVETGAEVDKTALLSRSSSGSLFVPPLVICLRWATYGGVKKNLTHTHITLAREERERRIDS